MAQLWSEKSRLAWFLAAAFLNRPFSSSFVTSQEGSPAIYGKLLLPWRSISVLEEIQIQHLVHVSPADYSVYATMLNCAELYPEQCSRQRLHNPGCFFTRVWGGICTLLAQQSINSRSTLTGSTSNLLSIFFFFAQLIHSLLHQQQQNIAAIQLQITYP